MSGLSTLSVVSPGSVAVKLTNVHKSYFNRHGQELKVLEAVSLEVKVGEMVALMGPSGCGKTTLLNIIGLLDRPTSGDVMLDHDIVSKARAKDLTKLRRDYVGIVFQSFNLIPTLTVAENVALPLIIQRLGRGEIAARVNQALAAVGIDDKSDSLPTELSGGQAQRAAAARAVIHRPAVVLADEPTGNLDSRSGAAVLKLLREFADSNQAILLATHSLEAAEMCDRVIRLKDGRVV